MEKGRVGKGREGYEGEGMDKGGKGGEDILQS